MAKKTKEVHKYHEGFLRYLNERIPSWQMPAEKFFKSFEQGIKRFVEKHDGKKLYSIFEITGISELEHLLQRMYPSSQYVYSNKDGGKKTQGLEYYIEFLKLKEKESDSSEEILKEGGILDCHGSKYERNKTARQKCIDHYGCKCVICDFDFETTYGKIGKNFIEVHHVIPLSEIKEEYIVDPIEHLRPLCSNCHSMIHRTNPMMGVENLKELYQIYNSNNSYKSAHSDRNNTLPQTYKI